MRHGRQHRRVASRRGHIIVWPAYDRARPRGVRGADRHRPDRQRFSQVRKRLMTFVPARIRRLHVSAASARIVARPASRPPNSGDSLSNRSARRSLSGPHLCVATAKTSQSIAEPRSDVNDGGHIIVWPLSVAVDIACRGSSGFERATSTCGHCHDVVDASRPRFEREWTARRCWPHGVTASPRGRDRRRAARAGARIAASSAATVRGFAP